MQDALPFGHLVKHYRHALGLTQDALAERVGCATQTIRKLEGSQRRPSYQMAARLALVLELAADERAAFLQAIPTRDTSPSSKLVEEPHPAVSPQNLPTYVTSFVGREQEQAEIVRLLAMPDCRLLSLVGPGGIGKTRLALEIVARQTVQFGDGVTFVSLASVGTPNQIVSAIGDTLNLTFVGQLDLTAYLISYLRERHMLLVLDNFDHLLDGVDLVSAILVGAPRVTILVTSRERLNLQTEWLFDIEGLSYPSAVQQGTAKPRRLADLADYSAVQLFVQRATQVQPLTPLTVSNLASIVRICQQVAGMPLAIELAAASVRILPIAAIEQLIHANLDELTATLRDVPARHRSLRAVFEHSWNLLSEPQRALLSHLAVFRGGWTADAAKHVTQATLPALTELVDKSLVRPTTAQPWLVTEDRVTEAASEGRFTLLEPIREYSLEQLVLRGEQEALQRSHATYYVALAEAATAHWDDSNAASTFAQLAREYDNMRAALRWARDGGDRTLGLQLGAALTRFWRRGGYIGEGRVWLEDLLSLTDTSSDDRVLTARLRAMHSAAWLATDQHDFAHADHLFVQSVALHHALGESESEGETSLLINAGLQARAVGNYRRATTLFEDALSRHRALGDEGSLSNGGKGFSLYGLALVLREQGDFARAALVFNECMDFHREINEREGAAQAMLGLSDVARDQGDVAEMRMYAEKSLAIFRDVGTQWAIGFALNNLAQAAYREHDLAEAFALVSDSVAIFRVQQADASLAEVLVTLGHILRAQGDVIGAHQTMTDALRLAQRFGPRLFVAAALEGFASVLVPLRQAALAARLLSAAAACRVAMGAPLRPFDQNVVEQTLASAYSILGADSFAAVWAEAQVMPLEQILNDVLGTAALDELP